MTTETSTTETNEQICRAVIERGFNNGDLDGLEAFVAHDIVEHQEGATSGIDGLRALITELRDLVLGPAPRDPGHRDLGRHRVVPHPCDRHQRRPDVGSSGDRPPDRHHRHGRHARRRRPHGRALGRRRSAGGPQADRRDGRRWRRRSGSADPPTGPRLFSTWAHARRGDPGRTRRGDRRVPGMSVTAVRRGPRAVRPCSLSAAPRAARGGDGGPVSSGS